MIDHVSMETVENCVELESFVRGYHAYTSVWSPVVNEILQLRQEPNNLKDNEAVAVVKDGVVVGHVPRLLSSTVFHFLSRECNNGSVKITGPRVNRGAGYGLEVPCIYCFYGPSKYLKVLQARFNEYQSNCV